MARSIPADRFSAIVAASARVFIAHGYQRTQVQDVADALALAKGTLYGYAQGKAALFAAAVRYGDAQEALPLASELPVAAPVAGEIAAVVSARLAGEVTDMRLTHALRATLPPGRLETREQNSPVSSPTSTAAWPGTGSRSNWSTAVPPSYPTSPRFGSAPAGTPKSMRSRHT
ncbi:TetR family transcriptional regulator [Mycobacterium tuberculosis]|uniref:TetR family transcriptional regulator n=1 Tax=Mycobacterium tuberculosis TaxID=1773 RepID=A0A654T609_MYCTX|nr:TetR family transcriptional regulator [Mycobacterium tuberculosis]COU63909.1 TetR family transcriptional regulator [Mycobacterium tuberculosis]COU69538.1 TetR family transcriptional regulator [Mycobacterium tuberculosis]COV26905.1 TetR family transcriptional regulator [Mycobacterium tuberculosis]COW18141.1 TetR family transcriptional regulator [Mycobacterium tuberculosis]